MNRLEEFLYFVGRQGLPGRQRTAQGGQAMGRWINAAAALAVTAILTTALAASAGAAGPAPGSPEYFQRDNQNMADAYGRQTAPDGQLNPNYLSALPAGTNAGYLQQVANQAANPTRPVLDPAHLVPGWNHGTPYRPAWPGAP